MGDFNSHHNLWGCEEVNNRGQQLENLILKNDIILFNDKSRTYIHSASGTFTSVDLTLSSPSPFLDFSWNVGPDPCGSDLFPIILENDGPPSLESIQRWKMAKANWDGFHHFLHRSLTNDADDPISLFTSILKDIAEKNSSLTRQTPSVVHSVIRLQLVLLLCTRCMRQICPYTRLRYRRGIQG